MTANDIGVTAGLTPGDRVGRHAAIRRQLGLSLIELMMASAVGFIAIVGILYLYKAQHKSMMIQGGASEMRMNGQFTLDESQYYLANVGLGLPANFKNLVIYKNDLVVRMNTTKKSSNGTLDGSSTTAESVFQIKLADTAIFSGTAYAAIVGNSGVLEVAIKSVVPNATYALITVVSSMVNFPGLTTLYPLQRLRLHRCTGIGADTVDGDFRILYDNPGIRKGLNEDSLTLAEGIETLKYEYFMENKDSIALLPTNLDSLQRIEIIVVAKSKVRDANGPGDGYHRDTLTAKVSYHRSL
jgi:hypothetical protein